MTILFLKLTDFYKKCHKKVSHFILLIYLLKLTFNYFFYFRLYEERSDDTSAANTLFAETSTAETSTHGLTSSSTSRTSTTSRSSTTSQRSSTTFRSRSTVRPVEISTSKMITSRCVQKNET